MKQLLNRGNNRGPSTFKKVFLSLSQSRIIRQFARLTQGALRLVFANKFMMAIYSGIWRAYHFIPPMLRFSVGAITFVSLVVGCIVYLEGRQYKLSGAESALLSKVSVDRQFIKEDDQTISYNRGAEQKAEGLSAVITGDSADSSGKFPYRASLDKTGDRAVTFSDSKNELSFTLTPDFVSSKGKEQDGRVVYPESNDVKHVYTFKRNGVKEDIILSKAPGDSYTRTWDLDLGDKLEARLLDDGSVGIYSANSYLFGNVQVSDDKSQQLIDNARKNGEKTNLTFLIPKPYLVGADGQKNYQDVSFKLNDDKLTLEAKNLKSKTYPLSIDPTVVVTTTADFQSKNSDESIDYSTADQINRSQTTSGAVGSISTSYFNFPRYGHAAVAANGYLYISGGLIPASSVDCKNTGVASTYCNDVQAIPVNADGTLGTITTAYFNVPRYAHASVIADGYLYIMGGTEVTSDTACKNTGVAEGSCNDIQRFVIGSGGALTLSGDVAYFNIPRYNLSAAIANGHLYVVGGAHNTSDLACVNTGVANFSCNDIQRRPIKADGSLGATTTSYFNTPRDSQSTNVANGYLYIIGGYHSPSNMACVNTGLNTNACNDIQRMAVNADGSLGAISTSYFNNPRYSHASTVSNGYLYISGGNHGVTDTACVNTGVATNYCNDIQRMAVNADGSLGTISTTYFNFPRQFHAIVASSSHIYVLGGLHITSDTLCVNTGVATANCNDIQRAPLGISVPTATTTSFFNVPRYGHSSAVANGFLYISGGIHATSDTLCSNTAATTACNDILQMAVNADGTLGTITTAANFTTPRLEHTMTIFNNYLYIAGGTQVPSDTACKNTGVASQVCNDIQRYSINSATGALTAAGATTYFATPRNRAAAVAHNGYYYVLGGSVTSTTDCKNTGTTTVYCNDIQRFSISSTDGSLTALTTSYFNQPRSLMSAVVANNYLYINGGFQENSDTACKNTGVASNYCNDIQRMLIATDGTLGTVSTSYFNVPRAFHNSHVVDGYLYIVAGGKPASDTQCLNTAADTRCNDIQRLKLNTDGSLGPIATSYFTTARRSASVTASNGFLYIIGGHITTAATACKDAGTTVYCNDNQRVEVGAASSLGSISTSYFNTPRTSTAVVVTQGQLYLIGGQQANSDTACKNTGIATNRCNDIQRMTIASDGSLGAITTSYFNTPRGGLSAVVYNNFLYISGGTLETTGTACKDAGSSVGCNDIQRMPIDTDGSLGTIATSYFNFPRSTHGMAAYGGFLYIAGGALSASATDCKNTGVTQIGCNDIQRMPINADGTLGTISTTYFNTPRQGPAVVTAGGILYIAGGSGGAGATTDCKNTGVSSSPCNDIQRMPINADGSLGAISTSYFNFPRNQPRAIIANNYFYIAGGSLAAASATDCKDTAVSDTRCNDIQRMPINADGSLGAISTSYLNTPRSSIAINAASGNIYIAGGTISTSVTACKNTGVASTVCNDIQRMPINSPLYRATYKKTVDLGIVANNVTSLSFNGTSCVTSVSYRSAGSDGIFGVTASLGQVFPGVAHSLSITGARYIELLFTLDDTSCGNRSSITDISVTYFQNPSASTLIMPLAGATGVALQPQFQLRASELQGNYLRYKIDVCSTADCSSIVRTIDQTLSQTGWTGQDTQTGTAYVGSATLASSTIATHNYQSPPLAPGTQYWWRAQAIDPADSNTFGAFSAIQSFTTNYAPTAPILSQPAPSQAGGTTLPQFRLYSTDTESDYLRYRIDVCSTNTCSVIVRTIDQTASQTGWVSQSQQAATAYSSGQEAVHTYQLPALTANTQYWWRAYAIDPAGSNTFSTASAIGTFTTQVSATPQQVHINGNVNIGGNVIIKP